MYVKEVPAFRFIDGLFVRVGRGLFQSTNTQSTNTQPTNTP
ncbi:MAG: hypothetical protein ACR2PT_12715 [Endozoicomonas sp.]